MSVDRDVLDVVTVHLTTEQDTFSNLSVKITVTLAEKVENKPFKLRKGDRVYFSGKLLAASAIEKEISVGSGAVARSPDMIINNGILKAK